MAKDKAGATDFDKVAEAFKRRDYRMAAQLVAKLRRDAPDSPWTTYYVGYWYEVTAKWEQAESIYRQLMRDTTNPKAIAQARQGLQRIVDKEKQRREQAIAKATSDPRNQEPAALILEPIPVAARIEAGNHLARIMGMDPYTARLQFTRIGWRLYRTGTAAQMQIYSQEFHQVGIPNFWVRLSDIPTIRVFRVNYLQEITDRITAICEDESNQQGAIAFSPSEVARRVEGALPLFISALDYNPQRPRFERFQRRTETQDFARLLDLHLPDRRCILRLCDSTYDFNAGVMFAPQSDADVSSTSGEMTNRLKWNALGRSLDLQLPTTSIWSEFTPFAETAILDYQKLLSELPTHIDLMRREPSPWDGAFQLYSALVFLRES